MRVRYVEIIDEEIIDLLLPSGVVSDQNMRVITNEWEGSTINGATWVSVSNVT